MCRTHVLAATAVLLLVAVPPAAHAWPFGGKKAAEPEAKAAEPAAKVKRKSGYNLAKPGPATTAPEPAPRKPATAEERRVALRLDPLAQAAFWTREVELNPRDAQAGLALSAALRGMGNHDQAAAAAERVLYTDPNNIDAMVEVARAHVGKGAGFYALEPLKKAKAARPNDWRLLSLTGVALEQAQRLPEARAAFAEALRLSPENPQVLTNVALSHMAEGNAAEAETLLRRAAARPDADIRVRQNLALVLGLRGRTAEAERMLREDLPPEQVSANLAWLRARTGAAPRTWGSVGSN